MFRSIFVFLKDIFSFERLKIKLIFMYELNVVNMVNGVFYLYNTENKHIHIIWSFTLILKYIRNKSILKV